MSIGIFGGTFNPIHYGHLHIAEQAREVFNLERILFIPNHQSAEGKHTGTSPGTRYHLTKLGITGHPYFHLDPIEIQRGGTSYTIDTIRTLQQKYTEKLYYIIGSDCIKNLHTWKESEILVKRVTFLIARRPGYSAEKAPKNCQYFETIEHTTSSSRIREYIQRGRSIRYLVPEKVFDYINKHRLYQEAGTKFPREDRSNK